MPLQKSRGVKPPCRRCGHARSGHAASRPFKCSRRGSSTRKKKCDCPGYRAYPERQCSASVSAFLPDGVTLEMYQCQRETVDVRGAKRCWQHRDLTGSGEEGYEPSGYGSLKNPYSGGLPGLGKRR